MNDYFSIYSNAINKRGDNLNLLAKISYEITMRNNRKIQSYICKKHGDFLI